MDWVGRRADLKGSRSHLNQPAPFNRALHASIQGICMNVLGWPAVVNDCNKTLNKSKHSWGIRETHVWLFGISQIFITVYSRTMSL